MSDSPIRVYWDSCAWIGFINKERDKLTPLRIIWEQAQKGKYEIWTSVYSYLEVIHGVCEHGNPYPPEQFDDLIYQMFNQRHVKRVQLDVETAKLARIYRRQYHPILSKRPDAIHLATAAYWNCVELHTWDGSDLLPLSMKVPRRDGSPLVILAPGPEVMGPLFAAAERRRKEGNGSQYAQPSGGSGASEQIAGDGSADRKVSRGGEALGDGPQRSELRHDAGSDNASADGGDAVPPSEAGNEAPSPAIDTPPAAAPAAPPPPAALPSEPLQQSPPAAPRQPP